MLDPLTLVSLAPDGSHGMMNPSEQMMGGTLARSAPHSSEEEWGADLARAPHHPSMATQDPLLYTVFCKPISRRAALFSNIGELV